MRLLDYNIAAPEGAVSVSGGYSIQGYKGGGKGGGGGSTRTPTEDQDNLHSIAYASVIDLVSAGPIHGFVDQRNPLRSVYLDSTPIQNEDGSLNFQDVQLEFRAGTQDQRYIPGFPAVESSSAVNVELRSDQPFTRAIQNVHISGVRVGLSVRGLKQQSTEAGDITGYRVEYVIELSTDGSAFAEVLRGAFDGKTTQQYSRSHRIDLPRANTGWSVRVRRITPNSSNSTISDVTYVDSITEVTDAKLRRPMSACVGIRVNAKQFQSIPTRAYHLYLRVVRVPSNYDAWTRSYVGTWDGTFKMSWTDNPAWVFYDLATNACDGLGRLLPAGWVDRWALYQIARYCDELVPDGKGGTEPRFSCNVYLQDKAEAWKVLQDLASVFRGLAYYAHGSVLAVADMPRDAVYTYSNANVVDGKFNYAGSGLKTRYTVALVSWNDETDMGRAKVEVVEDQEGIARYGVRQIELTAFACTSQGQAQRLGRSALFTSRMETESVTFGVGLSGTLAQPGQVIEVADAHRAGRRIGGLIKSATVNAVTLDAPARVSAGDRLTVVLPSGVSQTRAVAASVGQGAELQVIPVATPFSQAPQAEAAWSISAPDLATQKYRVLTVSEGPGLQHTITALQYVDGKHAAIDYQTRVETPPISVVPPPVQNLPANVVITSYHVLAQGQARHNAVISWDAAANAVAYEVQWRRDNSEWVSMPRTGSTSVEVPNIYAGGYVARVRAINVLDVSSLWATSALTQLNGEVSAPQPVTHLVAKPLVLGIDLLWGMPAGPNIIGATRIRASLSPEFADGVSMDFGYPTNSHPFMGLAAGQRMYFWAQLVDKNGTLGPWHPEQTVQGVLGQPSADADAILDYLKDQITAGQLAQELRQSIDLIGQIDELLGQMPDLVENVNSIPGLADGQQRLEQHIGQVQGRVDELNHQLDALMTQNDWDVGRAYATGDVVFHAGKMYRAKQPVPAGTAVADSAYWEFIGDFASITGALSALAVNVQEVTTRVEQAEHGLEIESGRITALGGRLDNAETGLSALAQLTQSMTVQIQELETGLSSTASLLTAVTGRLEVVEQDSELHGQAINNLETVQEQQGDDLRSMSSSLTSVSASLRGIEDNEQALLETALGAAEAELQAQDELKGVRDQIASTDRKLADKAEASAVASLTGRVERHDNELLAHGQDLVELKASLGDLGDDLSTKATAEALQQTDALVHQQGNDIEALGAAQTRLGGRVDDAEQGLETQAENLDQALSRVQATEEGQAATNSRLVSMSASIRAAEDNEQALLETALGAAEAAMQGQDGLAERERQALAQARVQQQLIQEVSQTADETRSAARSILQLQNQVADPATGLVAQAQAHQELSQEVVQAGEDIHAVGRDVSALRVRVSDVETQQAAQADALDSVEIWAGLVDDRLVAQASSINGLTADVGSAQANVALVQNALAETNGKLSATGAIKVEVSAGGKSYVAGMTTGVIVEPGKPVQSETLFLADRFAFLHLANGAIFTPFVIQGGQVFISQAFIGQSWIKSANIQSLDAYKIESQNLAAKLATIGTAYITSAHIQGAQIQNAHIVNASIDTLKIAGNAVAIHAGASAGAVTSGGPFRDIGVGVNLPYGGDVTIVAAIQSTVVQAAWADTSELFIDGGVYATIGCITDSTRNLMIGGTVVFKGWLGAGSHWIVLRQKLSWNGMLGHSGFTAAGISVICGMR